MPIDKFGSTPGFTPLPTPQSPSRRQPEPMQPSSPRRASLDERMPGSRASSPERPERAENSNARPRVAVPGSSANDSPGLMADLAHVPRRRPGSGNNAASELFPPAAVAVLTLPPRPASERAGYGALAELERQNLRADPELIAHTKTYPDGSMRTDFSKSNIDLAPGAQGPEHPFIRTVSTVQTDGRDASADAHFHPTNYVQRGQGLAQTQAMMDRAGVTNSVLMPIPTNLLSAAGVRYYTDNPPLGPDGCEQIDAVFRAGQVEGKELYPNTQVDHTAAAKIRAGNLSHAEKSRLDPMITGLHLGDNNSTDVLMRKLVENKGVFTGIGEITIHKELVEEMFAGKNQANLTDRVQPFKNLMAVAGVIGTPVTLHCDVDQVDNNQENVGQPGHVPQHLQNLKALFGSPELQNTTMVWAHAGGLGRFVKEPAEHALELEGMLEQNKNLHIDLSWSHVAKQLTTSPESIEQWAKTIEKFPDRFLMGSDSLAPQEAATWGTTVATYEPLLSQLKPETKEKLLNGNYQQVFVESRPKVRHFEETVLTPDFVATQLDAVDGPTTTADSIETYKRLNNISNYVAGNGQPPPMQPQPG